MSKFNSLLSGITAARKTTNLAGGEAFQQTEKLEVVSLMLTSFVQNQYYRTETEGVERLKTLIAKIPDKEFVAKAAIYARTEFGMRSVSHVLAGELARVVKGEPWLKSFYAKVVYRPDDITEILAYYIGTYGKPVPNAMKKGLAAAFDKFDAYQLAKYRGESKGISLIDAVNLCHPVPTEKNREALRQLMADELRSTETWEAKLTATGQADVSAEEQLDLKKDAWASLIRERKIGYFALLRNLRNILEATEEPVSTLGGLFSKLFPAEAKASPDEPSTLDAALQMLTDEKLIRKSLVLPFRFTTALSEIEKTSFDGTRKTIIALNKAVDIALSNVPKFDGKTLVVLDVSGSMQGRPSQIGSLFAAMLIKSNDADFITFSDGAMYRSVNPTDSTMTIAKSIQFANGGTNFNAIFETAKRAYDRIIILSDMQGWVGQTAPTAAFEAYKKRTDAKPRIYSFDLAGHGTMQFPEKDIFCIAGFSDKVFDVMKLLEEDPNALITKIAAVTL